MATTSAPEQFPRRRTVTDLAIATGRGRPTARTISLVVVGAILLAYAAGIGGYEARYALAISCAYALAVLGANVTATTSRDVNLAAGAQMAFGAYGAAFGLTHHWAWPLAVIFGVALAGAISFIIALGIVRLRGVYTALATFALAFSIPDLATYLHRFTGGGTGSYVLPVSAGPLSLGGAGLSSVTVLLVAFAVVGVLWLFWLSGGAGRSALMLDDAEPALHNAGRSAYWMKVRLWTVSGCIAGLGGVAYGLTVGYLNPQQFTFALSLQLFVGSVVGGMTSVVGALLGGVLVAALPIYLGETAQGTESIVFGILLLVALVVGKGGLWPRAEHLFVMSLRRLGRTR